MSRIAPALMASASARAMAQGQPGSNGYWRRQVYSRPGTFTWTAIKDGKVKVQAIGAGSGASVSFAGNPGHYGEKTLNVFAGQTLTIVVGTGGDGSLESATSTPGGTTSISGVPVGGTPLVLPGAPGVNRAQSLYGTPTFPSGPWDKSFEGGVGSQYSYAVGGPASASPFGPGVHMDVRGFNSGARGGCGWGGPARSASGASSHRPGTMRGDNSAWGKTARGGLYSFAVPETLPFWDLEDVDSAGASMPNLSSAEATNAGAGAGGGYGTSFGTTSALGGGTGFGGEAVPPQGGNGAGGVGSATNAANPGGKGGNGYVQIFWDEVA